MTTIADLKSYVEDRIVEEIELSQGSRSTVEDLIHEICDNAVPVMYSELAELITDSDFNDDIDDIECAGNNIFKIIQWGVYNQLVNYANEILDEKIEEWEESQEEDEDEEEEEE